MPGTSHSKPNREHALEQLSAPENVIDAQAAAHILCGFLKENPADNEIHEALLKYWTNIPNKSEILGELELLLKNEKLKDVWLTVQDLSWEKLKKISEKELLFIAMDYYDAGKYHQALRVYEEILNRDPNNRLAKDKIKACNLLISAYSPDVPKAAYDEFRKSISPMNRKDIKEAFKHLQNAVHIAKGENVEYVEAKNLLSNLDDALFVVDSREKAQIAIRDENWSEAAKKLKEAALVGWDFNETEHLLSQLQQLRDIDSKLTDLERTPSLLSEHVDAIKSVLSIFPRDNDIEGIYDGYRNQLLSRLQDMATTAADQLKLQANSAFEQANMLTSSLDEKRKLYEISVSLVNKAATLSTTFVSPTYISDAKNAIDTIQQGVNKIKALKDIGKFPKGLSQADTQKLFLLASGDPDVIAAVQRHQLLIRLPKYGAGVFALISVLMFVIAFFPGPLVSSSIFMIVGIIMGLLSLVALAVYALILGQQN